MGISEALRWIASAFVLPNRQMAKQPWQSSMNSVRSRNLATIWAQEQAAVLSSFPHVSTDQVDLSSHPPSLLFCLSRLKVHDFTPNSLRLRTLSAQSLMLRSTSHVRQGTGFFPDLTTTPSALRKRKEVWIFVLGWPQLSPGPVEWFHTHDFPQSQLSSKSLPSSKIRCHMAGPV